MNDAILEKIHLYCYMVQRGKPCACTAIQGRYIPEILKKINKNFEVKTYVEELSPGWRTLWIYKDEYMVEIIKLLPEEPKTIFEHWILGKAFGYSDEAIKKFLETKVCYK